MFASPTSSSSRSTSLLLPFILLLALFTPQLVQARHTPQRPVLSYFWDDAAMTAERCTAKCSSLGYTLAGLEYSTQCMCSSALATTSSAVAASECSMTCAGASSTSCGGPYRLNLYPFEPVTTAIAQTWVAKGCYSDSASPRTLPSNVFESSAMTGALCKATCQTAGYTYAGTQYSTQCWCANAMDPKGTLQPSSSCNSVCSGSSTEYCGGGYLLSVYQLVSSVASTTSSTSIVPSTSSTSLRSSTSISSTTSSSSAIPSSSSASSSASSTKSSTSSSSSVSSTSSSSSTRSSSSSSVSSATPSSQSGSSSSKSSSSSLVPSTTSSQSSATSSSSSATSSAASTTSLTAGSWAYSGCYLDASVRTLPSYTFTSTTSMTIDSCQVGCLSRGYVFAGLEAASECWCDSTIASSGTLRPDVECAAICTGNKSSYCGGNWRLSLFKYTSSGASLTPSATTTTTTTTTSTTSSTTSSSVKSSTTISSTSSSALVTTTTTTAFVPAATTSGKAVYAHFMMGNTYSYTAATWLSEIKLASAGGVDGFALNIGTDSWQLTGLDLAYAAAASSGTGFKLFLSLDMTVFGCSSYGQADQLKSLVTRYAGHPNQAKYASKVLVGTFAGSDCTFGQGGGWSSAWTSVFKTPLQNAGVSIFFVPAIFVDTSTFGSASVMDGELNWNGGWPTGNSGIDFSRDTTYLSALGSRSQGYMATVSPAFYTHYSLSTWNKNWIFKSDDWLFARRWQLLVENRLKFDMVEVLTWNDYGESSYIGSILADQPNSQNWVDGMDHLPLLEVNKYYATAFKTGQYPQILTDRIYLSSRPHSNTANAWGSGEFGRPTGGQNGDANGYLWPANNFFALVFAKSAGTVTSSSGSISNTFNVNAGVNFLTSGLSTGNGMKAVLSRSGSNVLTFQPSFTFTQDTQWFNWNYIYFASPA